MPRRNTLRLDTAESFYHVYVQGHSKRKIFRDEQDFLYFLDLLERYLSASEAKDLYGVSYPNFFNKVELAAFTLMPSSFHFLVYQHQVGALSSLMRSVMTSYSRYFNARHKRSGALFESRYRSVLIQDESYLEHISRYIHLTPRNWASYEYSSLPYYLQQIQASWVINKRVVHMFETPAAYKEFMENTGEHKKMLTILRHDLADSK